MIGLITTDGSLSNDGRHLDLTSKDIDQIKLLAKILSLNNKIGTKKSSYNPEGTYYRIQFGNVKLYRFLLSIGLTPNKTKTLSELKIPDQYFADFLRGHLDGDGCTHSYWDKRWKNSYRLYTHFCSASEKHLIWMKDKISNLYGVTGKIGYQGKSAYRLRFAKHNSIKLLNKMYYKDDLPCLKRKRSKIQSALGIIKEQNADVLELVDRHG